MTEREAVARELARQADDDWGVGRNYWLKCADEVIAIATEARRAETVQQGSVHDSAGPKDIAQSPSGDPS